jgi:protein TonB
VQITPPKIPVEAKIPMPEPALEAVTNLKMDNPNMPNLGMPTSNSLSTSLGAGKGTGMGDGNGPGLGNGRGGNWGGGDVKNIGGGITEPVVITQVEPEFSEEARRAKYPGDVIVSLIVDATGMPQNVHVLHGVGMGLDEKAVEAVKQYRFKPARENGKPVAVYMNVDVGFHIYWARLERAGSEHVKLSRTVKHEKGACAPFSLDVGRSLRLLRRSQPASPWGLSRRRSVPTGLPGGCGIHCS